MSQFESDLIQKLSARAAEPRAKFMRELQQELQHREQLIKQKTKPIRRQKMNLKQLITGLAAFVLLSGAAAFIVARNFNGADNDKLRPVAQTPTTTQSTSNALSLPNQQAQSLEEARESLSFEPLLPSVKLNNESLSDIKVGSKSNMMDDSDTIYLTYADSQGALYKLSQSTKSFNDPTDAKKVSITVGGKQVDAFYYEIEQPGGGGPASVGGANVPTSYLFWKQSGVRYEVSEFGRLSDSQLARIASSLE